MTESSQLQTAKTTEELWSDPANWSRLGLYRCAEDPRIWVPKFASGAGWTINTAHRRGRIMLWGIGASMVATISVAAALARGSQVAGEVLASCGVLVVSTIAVGLWNTRHRD